MVEMTRWRSSAAAWCRENDRFERVYPVERIVLAPSLPRVDEVSASRVFQDQRKRSSKARRLRGVKLHLLDLSGPRGGLWGLLCLAKRMAELAGPLRVMKIAIQTAKIAYPDYERESGTKWPDKHLDPAEAQLFAFAALRALDGAGFDIVPKKDKPDADRP
jgi:hypothetical protein